MKLHTSLACLAALTLTAVAGCASDPASKGDESDFASNQATLLVFEFDGSLDSDSVFSPEDTIRDQMLYTIGHLNADDSVGRLDKLELTNVKTTEKSGISHVTYHAKLPVAWGSKTDLPTSYELKLPRDVSSAALEKFTEEHKEACVDFAAHDVDSGSMWYYYRPNAGRCAIDDAELVKVSAKVSVSKENTSGKYPEYDKVWEDNALRVVAIFGKYENGKTTASDAGISAFNAFARSMKTTLDGATTTPKALPDAPGVQVPEYTFEKKLADGKTVTVTALLVDEVSTASETFFARYEELSTSADIIAYNGHAGLGQNVRALARRGKFESGHYQIFFMNGCDTFAYVDGSLAQTRRALNSDDPTGTKYMEFVTNAMPAFFSEMGRGTAVLMNGLLAYDAPKTYEQMFESVSRSQVIVVTGEEDNQFKPGMPIGKKK